MSGGIIPGIALGSSPASAVPPETVPGSGVRPLQVVDLRRTVAPGPVLLGATRSPVMRVYGITSLGPKGRVLDKGLFELLRWDRDAGTGGYRRVSLGGGGRAP